MGKLCTLDGCDKELVARGMCGMHYRRWRKHGDSSYLAPKPPLKPAEPRFWAKVNRGGPDDCWEYQAKRDRGGYGRFWLDGKTRGAHVVAWLFTRGPVPAGLCVLHRCDNPPCCNPTHLFVGTFGDNNADRAAKGRSAKAQPNKRGPRQPPRFCSISGCAERFLARGLCADHYREWRKRRTDVPVCTIEGCAQPFVARGWCHKHYKRWQKHGDPHIC